MCHDTIRNGFLTINFGWQNYKERPKQFTNNGYMAETAKRPLSDGVSL